MIYHSTLEEWPFEKLVEKHPQWQKALRMQQVHGDAVHQTGLFSDPSLTPECDAMLTSQKTQTLIIKTADCVPIAITDFQQNSFGAVHAGRAGTEKKILKIILQQMIENGSKPSNLYVYLGPSIGPCCYEINRNTHEKYDLWKKNQQQALEMNIPLENIKISGICTTHHTPKQYYSYRAGDLEKRFFTVISKIQS